MAVTNRSRVGLAGSALSGSLLAAGISVCAYDPALAQQTAYGTQARRASVPKGEVARACRRLILGLPEPKEVRGVLTSSPPSCSRAP